MTTKPVFASIVVAAVLAGTMTAAVGAAPAAGDAVRGGKLFLQCAACHTATSGAPHRVGPNLFGVLGAKAATRPGYAYSPALVKWGQTWDASSLDAFLKRPSQAVPGTKMAFGGVADAKARADLIAYLATLKAKK